MRLDWLLTIYLLIATLVANLILWLVARVGDHVGGRPP